MLLGRAHELRVVADALAANRPLVVVGEAGIGKTALLRAAAASSGRRVYEGGGLSTLMWMEYLPLRRALGRPVRRGDVSAVAADVEDVVRRGVLIVDDLQWADPATIEAVTILAGRVALVAGVRSGDPGADPVVDRLRLAGFEVQPVEALDAKDAADLVSTLRPDLAPSTVSRLVRRTGGNPLLLHELSSTGEPSDSLRLALAARLRGLDPDARDAFELLALAGHPMAVDDLGPAGAKALVHAGLADQDEDGDTVAVRHALLAEVAVEVLEPAHRRDLHSRLAGITADPGEAARHHAQAGEIELAYGKAMAAADAAESPGERANHLAVAAACATGPEADALRVRAARALGDAGDWAGVDAALEAIVTRDVDTHGWVCLLRSRAAWFRGDLDAMQAALAEGVQSTRGSGMEIEVRLRVEEVRVPIFVHYDFARGARMAASALELARAARVDDARAEYLLGTALGMGGALGWDEHLQGALARARSVGDTETEFRAANNVIDLHISHGTPAEGRRVAVAMIDRARSLGVGYWERCLRSMVVTLDFHAGAYRRVVEEAEALLSEPLDARTRDVTFEGLVMALVDMGRMDDATRRLTAWSTTALQDPKGQSQLRLVRAELALWAGRPRKAVALADEYLADAIPGDDNATFGRIVRGWACVDLGQDPGDPVERTSAPILRAVPDETTALSLLASGDHTEAVARFDAAADHWRPYHRRGELRCAWAAGEAARRAGDRAEAVERLEAVEATARQLEMAPLLARIERSLRAAGRRRSAPRTADRSGLTGREREVLRLVAEGLTNAEIAARLGTSQSTVAAQLASASARLGATSRAQAAALAAER